MSLFNLKLRNVKWFLIMLVCMPEALLASDEMMPVAAGEFIMGSDKYEKDKVAGEFGNAKPWYMDEHPQHKMIVKSYELDVYEVTYADYAEYVKSQGVMPPENWMDNGYILSLKPEKLLAAPVAVLRKVVSQVLKLDVDSRMMKKEDLLVAIEERLAYMNRLPVTYVTWADANNYCKWQGKHLPTEAQWEKAARGKQGLEFPWGNKWVDAASNSGSELWRDGAAPVGSYPKDKSPFGVYDMGGNVSEWVADWYQPYPGSDYSSKDFGQHYKVARGGAWGGEGHYTLHLFYRAAYRANLDPAGTYEDVGFRCAKGGEKEGALISHVGGIVNPE